MQRRSLVIRLLFLVFMLFASGSGAYPLDQMISLRSKKMTLGQVFISIQRQSPYLIIYSSSDINPKEEIILESKRVPLDMLLQKICDARHVKYEITNNYIVFSGIKPKESSKAVPDTIAVRGVVLDRDGQPIAGAFVKSLQRKGSGDFSDGNGSFNVRTRKGDVLEISCLGYKTVSFPVESGRYNRIVLHETEDELKEVVIVGYGSTKRGNVTGSVEAVYSESFEDRPLANMQHSLMGLIPSLNVHFTDGKPARQASFQLRGAGSLSAEPGSSNALVLIDGVADDPEMLNPDDIESLSILKDAASAAIYGAQGAYGVILITTKKPPLETERVQIKYAANYSLSTPPRLPDNVTDGLQFTELAMKARYGWNENYGLNQLTSCQELFGPSGNRINIDHYYSNFQKWRSEGKGSDVDIADDGHYIYYGSTDWTKLIYRKAASSLTQHLSVKGNTGKMGYYLSGRLYSYDGLYRYDQDDYRSLNLRSKVTIQLFPWLRLLENITYSNDYLHQPVTMETDMDSYDGTVSFSAPESQIGSAGIPTLVPFNPDGTLTRGAAYVFGSMIGRHSYVDLYKNNFLSTSSLEASFFADHLRLHADFSYIDRKHDRKAKKTGVEYSRQSGVMENLLNADQLHRRYLSDIITLTAYKATNLWAEWELSPASRHYFKSMAGFNYEIQDSNQYRISKRGLEYEDSESYEFAQGEWDGTTYINTTNDFTSGFSRWRQAGLFFRFNYAFDDRYLFEMDGRYDGSSRFLRSKQWSFFPSASVGWRISSEPWWGISERFVDNLKVRFSYGELGDATSLQPYAFDEYYTLKSYRQARVIDGNANASYMEYPQEVFPDLTWATVRTADLGMDASLFMGRVNLMANVFVRKSVDMIVEDNRYPVAAGTVSAKSNSADMTTRGWESSISWNDRFRLGGDYLHIGMKTSVSDNYTVIDRYINDSGSISADTFRKGQRYGEVWGFVSKGIFSSQEEIDEAFVLADGTRVPYQNTLIRTNASGRTMVGDIWLADLDGDGKITIGDDSEKNPGDRRILGNVSPRFFFNASVFARWKGFYLEATLDGIGHQDWSPPGRSAFYGMFGVASKPTLKWTADNMWTGQTPEQDALFPRLSAGNRYFYGYTYQWGVYRNQYPVDRYIFNIAYVRLANFDIGYHLPAKVLRKTRISDVRISVKGDNVWNWSPFYRYTRDFDIMTINSHGDDQVNGINWDARYVGQQYPMLRTWSVGISVSY